MYYCHFLTGGLLMLNVEHTVLMIVDVQGKLAQLMYQKEALFESLRRIIKGATILEIPIIWMEQIPQNLGPTLPEIAEVMPQNVKPISKSTFSCCGNEQFVQALKAANRRQVLIAGIESHICIYQTSVDLLAKGYEVQVLTDCVSSRTLENRQLGIERIRDAGGKCTGVEMALFELLKAAEGPKFKEMVKIVK